MLTKEFFKKIIDEFKGDQKDLPVFLETKIKQVSDIENRIKKHHKKKADLYKKQDEQELELEDELKKIQEDCPHLSRSYEPDPSGNHDSHFYCSACGKNF